MLTFRLQHELWDKSTEKTTAGSVKLKHK